MEENLKQQASYIIKIALVGPESTGKTTLSKQLAQHFETVWTPEFARNYLQEKWDGKKQICESEDLLPIAIGQTKLENENLSIANKFLFCDTSLLVTKVFSEIYYSFCDPIIDKAARKHKYDLFFLTDIDVPWQKDDLRDKPNDRESVFEFFKNALIQNQKPFIILSGNKDERLKKAIAIIENLENAKKMGFSSQDFVQIFNHGIPLEQIAHQINIFKKGISKTILDRAATINDGVLKLSDTEWDTYIDLFENEKSKNKLCKFVPASGAASRMFKFLLEFLNDYDFENETINAYINRKNAVDLSIFLIGLDKFPFYKKVITLLEKSYSDFNKSSKDERDYHFIKMLLSSDFFDYANKPKGILPFHNYKTHLATPIEEHLNESVCYANSNGNANLHFTISESNQVDFDSIIKKNKGEIEEQFEIKINIDFSNQNKSTDTIAVDLDNNPVRNEDGNLVFRPGGHGALIQNLNEIDADIIFIKNIDNIIQNQIETIGFYKKGLAGILINLQQKIFQYLFKIEHYRLIDSELEEILNFSKSNLHIEIGDDFEKFTFQNKIEFLKIALNKPIRICGMVKNEGEPGGGPFWVFDKYGNASLQIVESVQVDLNSKSQVEIFKSATHFNPVDLVCSTKNYKHQKFDLNEFVDSKSGFIVEKNKNGKVLKGYELPGLWNGAMAKWITIFVEVPLITFNPVKTVNDLLKPAHQPT